MDFVSHHLHWHPLVWTGGTTTVTLLTRGHVLKNVNLSFNHHQMKTWYTADSCTVLVFLQKDQQVAAVHLYGLTRIPPTCSCSGGTLLLSCAALVFKVNMNAHIYIHCWCCSYPIQSWPCDWEGSSHRQKIKLVIVHCRLPDPWSHQCEVRDQQSTDCCCSPVAKQQRTALCWSAPRKEDV